MFKLRMNAVSAFVNDNRETFFHHIPQLYQEVWDNVRRYGDKFKSSQMFQTLLGSPNDKIDDYEKSGIFEMKYNYCDNKYVGQRGYNLVLLKMF